MRYRCTLCGSFEEEPCQQEEFLGERLYACPIVEVDEQGRMLDSNPSVEPEEIKV